MQSDPLPNQPAEAADLRSHPCNVTSDAMPQRNSSRTALGVAVLRAVHQLLDCEPKILEDPIAARLLGADVVQQIQSHPARATNRGPGHCARTWFYEAAMRKSAWPKQSGETYVNA